MSAQVPSAALTELLDELAQRPDSLLFHPHHVRLRPSLPEVATWAGHESGLAPAERELLASYREELAALVRQLSFALTRDRAQTRAQFDPELDQRASAQAVPGPELEARRRACRELPERDRLLPGAARLLAGLESQPLQPLDLIPLLHQVQRIAPHPMTLQHLAFWCQELGDLGAARAAALAGLRSASDALWRSSLLLILGRIDFLAGRYASAATWYARADTLAPTPMLILCAWHCAVCADQKPSAERFAATAEERIPNAQLAARELSGIARALGLPLTLTRGLGPASDRWIETFKEVG